MRARHRYRAEDSRGGFEGQRLDPFVADEPVSVSEAGLNILTFQPWIALKDRVRRVTRRQHTEDMLDGESATSDNRLATEDARVDRNAFQKGVFIRRGIHRLMIAYLDLD